MATNEHCIVVESEEPMGMDVDMDTFCIIDTSDSTETELQVLDAEIADMGESLKLYLKYEEVIYQKYRKTDCLRYRCEYNFLRKFIKEKYRKYNEKQEMFYAAIQEMHTLMSPGSKEEVVEAGYETTTFELEQMDIDEDVIDLGAYNEYEEFLSQMV